MNGKGKFIGSRQNVACKFARMHCLLSCRTTGTKSAPARHTGCCEFPLTQVAVSSHSHRLLSFSSFWSEWHQEDTVKFSHDGLFPLTESKELTCQDLMLQAVLSCWLDFCLTSTILLMKREESLCHYGENTEKDFCCRLDLFSPAKKPISYLLWLFSS